MNMDSDKKTLFRKEIIIADMTPKLDFQFKEKKKKGTEDVSEG